MPEDNFIRYMHMLARVQQGNKVNSPNIRLKPKSRKSKKSSPSELSEQIKLFNWIFHNKDLYKVSFAIPNGGSRTPIEGALLKRSGVKPGVPDIFIACAKGKYHGLFIELKIKGGKISLSQKNVIEDLREQGFAAIVCYGADEAIAKIEKYLAL